MHTIELYRRVYTEAAKPEAEEEKKQPDPEQASKSLELVTKYKMPNGKCLDMTKLSIQP